MHHTGIVLWSSACWHADGVTQELVDADGLIVCLGWQWQYATVAGYKFVIFFILTFHEIYFSCSVESYVAAVAACVCSFIGNLNFHKHLLPQLDTRSFFPGSLSALCSIFIHGSLSLYHSFCRFSDSLIALKKPVVRS